MPLLSSLEKERWRERGQEELVEMSNFNTIVVAVDGGDSSIGVHTAVI